MNKEAAAIKSIRARHLVTLKGAVGAPRLESLLGDRRFLGVLNALCAHERTNGRLSATVEAGVLTRLLMAHGVAA